MVGCCMFLHYFEQLLVVGVELTMEHCYTGVQRL